MLIRLSLLSIISVTVKKQVQVFGSGDFLVDSRDVQSMSCALQHFLGFCKLLNINKRYTEFSVPKLYSGTVGQSLRDF